MDDRQLIARVLAGEEAAERLLYDAHVERVYRLAYRLAGDDDLARELTQEAFLRIFDRLPQFRFDAALGTWIYAVAMSVVLTGLRRVRRRRMREVPLDDAPLLTTASPPRDPELEARVAAAIDALPEIYRVVFVMHELEGFTHEEIGAALGLAPGTSKARLARARIRLRTALSVFAEELS